MAKTNKVGTNLSNYENTNNDNVYKQSEILEKLYKVIFKQNRMFELYINDEKIIWECHGINPVYPAKYKDGLPETIINHESFKTNLKYFTVVKI